MDRQEGRYMDKERGGQMDRQTSR
ncbi:hypothetical protein BIW11_13700 [Tropilaelaps mercedesae]|uniref:Uncharacterized protein n=1 Tax=Tropilaelaps mercedesae TaxID=418985 RepID=A0A1V9X0V4_9ACAR|nr:hypothetical protein BIW11_13700 [Tropilaelaps mercedesae]